MNRNTMPPQRNILLQPRPLVVATVHTARGLSALPRPGPADLLELRLDLLAAETGVLERAAARAVRPLLLTARHPAEGGAPKIGVAARRELLLRFLPRAAALDVELRSVSALGDVLAEAHRRRCGLVVSFHDFRRTPGLAVLRGVVRRAAAAGADVVKVAVRLKEAGDLATLLQLVAADRRVPVAAMGMGPLGRASRLVLAVAGSRLNYGYVDRPQVEGQWPADLLRRRIDELLEA